MRIFLLGLPGAGKGVQGKALSQALQIPHISLGDRARELARSGTSELANAIRAVHQQEKWQPLSTDVAAALFRECLPDAKASCIVDGFPRNLAQKQAVEWCVDSWGCDDTLQNIFIYLELSEEESRRRVLNRDRSGDSLEKWQRRIELERNRLPELIENLPTYDGSGRNWNSLIEIDGEQPVEVVTQAILNHWLIRYLQLSEADRDLVFGLIDPYDRCFGSIFSLHEEDAADKVERLINDGRSLKEQWEALLSDEEKAIETRFWALRDDDSISL